MLARLPAIFGISLISLLAASPVFAQTSGGASSAGGGSASSGTAGPSRSGSTPSATSPSRAGPTNGALNSRDVAPNAVPSPGNSTQPSQSSGTAPGSTPGTPRSGQGVTGTNPQGATGSQSTNGRDPTTVEPNFRGGNAPATAQDGKPNADQPGTGGIQGMGERSSTSDTGAYGKSVDECMTAFDPANHMSKEQWRETCQRTTTR